MPEGSAASETGTAREPSAVLLTLLARPEFPALVFLLLLAAVFSVTTRGFFAASNLLGIVEQGVIIAIVGLAVNQGLLNNPTLGDFHAG